MTATALALVTDLRPDRAAWDREVRNYQSHLVMGNKSPRTIETYLSNLATWATWRTDRGLTLDPREATRAEARAFALDQATRYTPNTAKGRVVSVGTFFAWLVTEWAYGDEHRPDPFAGVEGPKVPKVRVPVLTPGQVDALLAACDGRTFDALRDRAIIALLVSTGMRRTELANLTVGDLGDGFVRVVQGKGARDRLAPYGAVAAEALRHYLRKRDHHGDAGLAALFLVTPGHGHRGAMSGHGVAVMIARRSEAAGLGHVHPHQLRHTFAHEMLAADVPEGAVMAMGGWTTRAMLDRYGADLAQERALLAYRDPLARGKRGR